MAGTLRVGGKVLATHDSGTDEITLKNASVDETFSGIMEVDQWYLNQNYLGGQSSDEPNITTKDSDSSQYWSRNNFTGFSKIGTGLTNTNGIFSFPITGVYEINPTFVFFEVSGGTDSSAAVILKITIDNSTYNNTLSLRSNHTDSSFYHSASGSYILNVSNISNIKFKFSADSFAGNNGLSGSATAMYSFFTIKRLGPAQ